MNGEKRRGRRLGKGVKRRDVEDGGRGGEEKVQGVEETGREFSPHCHFQKSASMLYGCTGGCSACLCICIVVIMIAAIVAAIGCNSRCSRDVNL